MAELGFATSASLSVAGPLHTFGRAIDAQLPFLERAGQKLFRQDACALCKVPFDEAEHVSRLLDCAHHFCAACLGARVRKDAARKYSIVCPYDHQETVVKKGDVSSLTAGRRIFVEWEALALCPIQVRRNTPVAKRRQLGAFLAGFLEDPHTLFVLTSEFRTCPHVYVIY